MCPCCLGKDAPLQTVVDRQLLRSGHMYEAGAPFVFVVEDEKAVRRALELGFTERDRVEVLSGVSEGEGVVVVGQSILRDGAEVKATP